MFAREHQELETECPVERSLIRARNAKDLGVISAPEFYRISDKVDSLKKLKFVEEYEYFQDKAMYEWIKYKVAADIGGQEEREAYALYEKIKQDELGEARFKLLRDRAHDSAFNL